MIGPGAADLIVGAVVAFTGVWLMCRLFSARETYFVWTVPVFLFGMLIAALAFTAGGRPLFIGALGGLVAGSVACGRRSWQLHRLHPTRLEAFARERGLSYVGKDDTFDGAAGLLVDDVGGCSNMIRGNWRGVPVALFDYSYLDTSDGEAPAMIVLTYAATVLDDERPRMIIRGLTVRESLGQRFGAGAGAFSDPDFDRQFRVETADLELAKRALGPRSRAWLVANARGWRVLVDGSTVLLGTGHRTIAQLPDLLERLASFRATFPRGL